ncbi:MAG: radical SAM protein [Desulfobacterales bacterium]|nr:radical SAM protein [Desulfobacterales bacterium]MDJ0874448.1 radical SAM protein [Desulfobacterales bacterium]MDJ0882844.1 radical SAM protein [Desulfobacterales bacterium]
MARKRTVAFSRSAVNLFFHILTRCNLNCRHCYINPDQHGSQTLPFDTIRCWLEAFQARSRETNLVLLGGEPTLHRDLARIIRMARKLAFASVTVDTNGYLFHDILDRVAPSDVDYFSFSLDGPTPAVNDPLRGKGSFDVCTAGIRKAVSRGFTTSLIYTVSSANIDHLDRMGPLLQDLGIARFFIQVIGLRGQSAIHPEAAGSDAPGQVSRGQWCDIVPPVAARIADLGITVTYPKVFLEPGEAFACAGKVADNYFVFPNGRVYRCPLCEDYPLHSLAFSDEMLRATPKINEADLFELAIPEGCVMNRLVQPGNIEYGPDGRPLYQIACCLLKEEVRIE